MPTKKDATRRIATMTEIAANLFLDNSHHQVVRENILKILDIRTICSRSRTGKSIWFR